MDFFNCGSLVTNESLAMLCNQCRNVESLCVSEFRNRLADQVRFAAFLSCFLSFCAFFLHRPHCSIKIVERIAEHTTLKSVMARRSNITDTALQSLLAHCPNLTALDFSESHMVTNEGLLLLEPLAPQLRKLRMLGLPVADSFCELVLGRATSLTELCLSHCSYITDDGWAQLAACKGMELFQCFYSSLTGECLLRLVAHWPRLVRVLDVRGIRFASRDELAALRRVVPATCKITFLLGNSDGQDDGGEPVEGTNNQT